MRAVDIIRKKRDGGELTAAEIGWMVAGIDRGDVPDYQWSALLMAIYMMGMGEAETAALTEAMMHSGSVIDPGAIPGRKIDKHSTGGVGDKTSLILAPIAAAAGVLVPKLSGRGLGHTGGTLDKLESIPGLRVDLDPDRFREVLGACGLVVGGQTARIAPADKFLYALRDATATVESIPLIASSIMSKKLAGGTDGLVLDVKTGNGAFMVDEEDSVRLATAMCEIGRNVGKKMVALISRMDQPLGRAVGNAVEVLECVECLRGGGPADLVDLSVELASEMVLMGARAGSLGAARERCRAVIADGSALERLRAMVVAQGGDPGFLEDPPRLPTARRRVDLLARRGGYVRELAARPVGHAAMLLGAGRARVDSAIDHAVGVVLHKKVGDPVREGEALCTLLVNDETHLGEASALVLAAFAIGEGRVEPPPLIIKRIEL